MVQKENSSKSSPFTDRGYDISIKINEYEDLPILKRWGSTSHVSELSRRVFFALFDLIAGECLKDNYTENIEDEFGNISSTLFKNFNLENLDDKGSLEDSIEDYIREVEKYHLFLPKRLTELIENKKLLDSLTPYDTGIGYDGDLDSVLECIREVLKTLRDEKITFWKKIYRLYKKDKEGYDLDFRTRQTRRKNDLERFSKINIKEYIKKLDSIGEEKENNKR